MMCFNSRLSYMPKSRRSSVPILKHLNDPIDRDVTYSPRQNQPYDPRWLLTGRHNNDDDDSSPGGGLMQPVA